MSKFILSTVFALILFLLNSCGGPPEKIKESKLENCKVIIDKLVYIENYNHLRIHYSVEPPNGYYIYNDKYEDYDGSKKFMIYNYLEEPKNGTKLINQDYDVETIELGENAHSPDAVILNITKPIYFFDDVEYSDFGILGEDSQPFAKGYIQQFNLSIESVNPLADGIDYITTTTPALDHLKVNSLFGYNGVIFCYNDGKTYGFDISRGEWSVKIDRYFSKIVECGGKLYGGQFFTNMEIFTSENGNLWQLYDLPNSMKNIEYLDITSSEDKLNIFSSTKAAIVSNNIVISEFDNLRFPIIDSGNSIMKISTIFMYGSRIYVLTSKSNSNEKWLLYSDDNGITWHYSSLATTSYDWLKFESIQGKLYAWPEKGVLLFLDNANDNWQTIILPQDISIGNLSIDNNIIAISSYYSSDFFLSHDYGLTWSKSTNSYFGNTYINSLYIEDNKFFIGFDEGLSIFNLAF